MEMNAVAGTVASALISAAFDVMLNCVSDRVARNPITLVKNRKQIFMELKSKLNDLEAKREKVLQDIDEALQVGDVIEEEVMYWMRAVKKLINRNLMNELEDKAKRIRYANLKSRYQLNRQAEKYSQYVVELLDRGNFNRISYFPVQRQEVAFFKKKQEMAVAGNFHSFQNFNSRRVLKDIMEALLSPGINSIGVHGVAGVGKTMVVEQIKRKAEEVKLFDVVVMAKVTKNPDWRRIQDEIARDLGIEIPNRLTWGEAADRIKSRLTNRKVLVILDDIWEITDLEKVGIPYGNKQKLMQPPEEKNEEMSSECTVMLTSRHRHLLSQDDGMNTQKIVEVPPLEEGEAWELFWKIAGKKAENQRLLTIAKEISKKCGGLPFGIATLANTLKSKSPLKWRIILLRLQKNPNLSGMSASLYSAIELRYSELQSKELRQTLLLCSLMGHNARLQDLLKYGIGLGLFPRAKTIEEARDEALKLVSELIRDYSLLLNGSRNMHFDMHELIREVAISIASGDHGVLAFRKNAAKDRLDKKALKKSKWIYLSNVDATELPDELKCPQLSFFHLSTNYDPQAIPNYLFRGATGLRVLGLTKVHFLSIPPSISVLINLRTLCLDQSQFGHLGIGSIIGKLKNLQVLSLARCDIQKLPEEIGKLIRLKFLDLSNCSKLKEIPPGVLLSLSQLEELYLGNSFDQWEEDIQKHEDRKNASLDELRHLENLTALEVRIRDIKMIPDGLFSVELKRYKIFIGDVWNNWKSSFVSSKRLKLKLDGSSSFNYSVRKLLNKAEELHLKMLNGVKNVVNELDDSGFQELKYLHVNNDPKILHMIFNSVKPIPSKIFPNLEVLFLRNLMEMEKIFHGQFEKTSFGKLRIITVECCGKLKNLFSFSIAKQLLHLQEFRVTDCSEVVEIFDDEEEEDTDYITEAIDVIKLAQLKHLRLQYLPKFHSFSHEKETNVSFFNEKLEVPELLELQLSWINVKTIWPARVSPTPGSKWKLTKLIIQGCNNLENMFSSSIGRCLEKLKHLEIGECKMLREIIVTENAEEMDNRISFSELNFLQIENLQNLVGFCSGNYRIKFPSLKQLAIENCPELKGFVVDSTSTDITALFDEKVAFPNLERMTISHLNNLKIIWKELPEYYFHRLNFLRIEDLPNLIGLCLENSWTAFSYLKHLTIENCPELNGFVAESISTDIALGIQALFDEKIAFPNLERMTISQLKNLKIIWKNLAENSFRSLKSLRVTYCQNLSSIFPSNNDMPRKLLKSLEKLEIIGCKSVEKVFELRQQSEITESDAEIKSPLKELYIDQLPKLQHVWNKNLQETDTFQNLESVTVSRCESLNHLFPFPLAKSLSKLKRLKIQSCTSLEEIVAMKSAVEEEEVNFEFDSLSCLILDSLPRLRCFYPGKHKKHWPELEKFYSYHCGEMKITNKQGQPEFAVELPLFSLEKDLPELKKLSLTDDHIRIISKDQRSTAGLFNNIEVLRIQGYRDESTLLPINFIQKFRKLEKLVVESCDFKKLFPSNYIGKQSSIRRLKLKDLPNSRHIWSQDSSVPQNLETLKLWHCESLISLSTSTASFPTLMTLDVWSCQEMINLVSLSTAQSLVKLKSLSVRICQGITEIVGKDEPATQEEINFKELRYLRLECLTRLSSFCSGDFTFKFPSLERVIVDQCPNLTIFCQGVLETPILQRVQALKRKDKWHWTGDLNATIKNLYEEKDGAIGRNAQGANRIDEGMEKEYGQEKEGNEDNGLDVNFEIDDLDPSVAQDAQEHSSKMGEVALSSKEMKRGEDAPIVAQDAREPASKRGEDVPTGECIAAKVLGNDTIKEESKELSKSSAFDGMILEKSSELDSALSKMEGLTENDGDTALSKLH